MINYVLQNATGTGRSEWSDTAIFEKIVFLHVTTKVAKNLKLSKNLHSINLFPNFKVLNEHFIILCKILNVQNIKFRL